MEAAVGAGEEDRREEEAELECEEWALRAAAVDDWTD